MRISTYSMVVLSLLLCFNYTSSMQFKDEQQTPTALIQQEIPPQTTSQPKTDPNIITLLPTKDNPAQETIELSQDQIKHIKVIYFILNPTIEDSFLDLSQLPNLPADLAQPAELGGETTLSQLKMIKNIMDFTKKNPNANEQTLTSFFSSFTFNDLMSLETIIHMLDIQFEKDVLDFINQGKAFTARLTTLAGIKEALNTSWSEHTMAKITSLAIEKTTQNPDLLISNLLRNVTIQKTDPNEGYDRVQIMQWSDRFIVLYGVRNFNTYLIVYDVQQGKKLEAILVLDGNHEINNACISSDGTYIAYVFRNGNQLAIMNMHNNTKKVFTVLYQDASLRFDKKNNLVVLFTNQHLKYGIDRYAIKGATITPENYWRFINDGTSNTLLSTCFQLINNEENIFLYFQNPNSDYQPSIANKNDYKWNITTYDLTFNQKGLRCKKLFPQATILKPLLKKAESKVIEAQKSDAGYYGAFFNRTLKAYGSLLNDQTFQIASIVDMEKYFAQVENTLFIVDLLPKTIMTTLNTPFKKALYVLARTITNWDDNKLTQINNMFSGKQEQPATSQQTATAASTPPAQSWFAQKMSTISQQALLYFYQIYRQRIEQKKEIAK